MGHEPVRKDTVEQLCAMRSHGRAPTPAHKATLRHFAFTSPSFLPIPFKRYIA